jgi:hypothetical protein
MTFNDCIYKYSLHFSGWRPCQHHIGAPQMNDVHCLHLKVCSAARPNTLSTKWFTSNESERGERYEVTNWKVTINETKRVAVIMEGCSDWTATPTAFLQLTLHQMPSRWLHLRMKLTDTRLRKTRHSLDDSCSAAPRPLAYFSCNVNITMASHGQSM